MKARVVDPMVDPGWAELVATSSDAGIFHHPLWLRLLHEQYRYPVWACCLELDGALVAGVPVATLKSPISGNRLVSLPFSDHVPAIYGGRADELERHMMLALEAERSRRDLPLELHAEATGLPGVTRGDRFYHHVLALDPDFEAVRRGVKSSNLRNVRRAVSEGVRIHRRTDRGALTAFFRMHVLTRHRQGAPTQPKRFFLRLRRLFDEGLGFVLVAEWEGRPIAAAVYLQFNGTLTYKYGASDPRHLDKRANPFIHIEAMRYGSENGFRALDLGRTDVDNPGLRRFKLSFGAQEHELSYSFGGRRGEQPSVRSVSRVQQAIIRRSPPLVGRLVGGVLYRHFG